MRTSRSIFESAISSLQALLAERSALSVDLGKAPRAGSRARAQFDVRQHLANWAGADLTRINGLGLDSVMKILSEIGTDLDRFESSPRASRRAWRSLRKMSARNEQNT
jgi:hypothetical protein